jgi:hypothetical protein
MKRRELITLLGGAAVPSFLGQFAAWAQQGPIPVIGYLSSLTQADSVHSIPHSAAAFPKRAMSKVAICRSNTAG